MTREFKVGSQRAHPRCINAGNPYHTCSDFCLKKVEEKIAAERPAPEEDGSALPRAFGKKRYGRPEPGKNVPSSARNEPEPSKSEQERSTENLSKDADSPLASSSGKQENESGDGLLAQTQGEEIALPSGGYEGMSEREKKLFDLRLKLNQARKANQSAIVAEKKRTDGAAANDEGAGGATRGVSKAKWYEEKKKRVGKLLESQGLTMKEAYLLDTAEEAEQKYKKREKKAAPFGWDVFNQTTLYKAYEKRTENIPYTLEEFEAMKEREGTSAGSEFDLNYGKSSDTPQENVDRMVSELEDRKSNRKEFSRRRKFHDERDVDSINHRNEHFNKKIERAFGKYTLEIKSNLERGTALPD